ncbi:MAG: HAD family hydrolase [Lachnospiraceae bacterium]|nr:HAD family hydrolase [Lachnospiraceae bacterium]
MKYKAILFDIDGTLLDTEQKVIISLQHALLRMTNTFYPEESLYSCLGLPGKDGLRKLGIAPEKIDYVHSAWEEYDKDYPVPSQLFQGIKELLILLKASHIKLGIVTSQTHLEYAYTFRDYTIAKIFDFCICSDDTEHPKPSPDPLLRVMKQFSYTPDELLYIGDTIYDLQCACTAGVDFALALWGAHDPDNTPAEYRLTHPRDLLHFL